MSQVEIKRNWRGGSNPCYGHVIDVLYRNGERSRVVSGFTPSELSHPFIRADGWRYHGFTAECWGWNEVGADIVGFRYIDEREEHRKPLNPLMYSIVLEVAVLDKESALWLLTDAREAGAGGGFGSIARAEVSHVRNHGIAPALNWSETPQGRAHWKRINERIFEMRKEYGYYDGA